MLDPAVELEILRSIVKRAKSAKWWARLSYPTDQRYWNEQEREVLRNV